MINQHDGHINFFVNTQFHFIHVCYKLYTELPKLVQAVIKDYGSQCKVSVHIICMYTCFVLNVIV